MIQLAHVRLDIEAGGSLDLPRELIRHPLLERYGKYLATALNMTKEEVLKGKKLEPEAERSLNRYWTKIHSAVKGEQRWYDDNLAEGKALPAVSTPTTTAIRDVARRTNFGEDELLSAVESYAEGKGEFDSESRQIMIEERAPRLAQTLFQDLNYLHSASEDKAEVFADQLETIIVAFRDTFFDVRSGGSLSRIIGVLIRISGRSRVVSPLRLRKKRRRRRRNV